MTIQNWLPNRWHMFWLKNRNHPYRQIVKRQLMSVGGVGCSSVGFVQHLGFGATKLHAEPRVKLNILKYFRTGHEIAIESWHFSCCSGVQDLFKFHDNCFIAPMPWCYTVFSFRGLESRMFFANWLVPIIWDFISESCNWIRVDSPPLFWQVLDSLTHYRLWASYALLQYCGSACAGNCQVSQYAQGPDLWNQCRQVKYCLQIRKEFAFTCLKAHNPSLVLVKKLYRCIEVSLEWCSDM